MGLRWSGPALAGLMLACGLSAAQAADFTIRASHGESTDSALHKGWEVFKASSRMGWISGMLKTQSDQPLTRAQQIGDLDLPVATRSSQKC